MSETEKKAPPVFRKKVGMCEATVWEQDGKNGKFFTIATKRSYNAGTKEKPDWKDTNSLRVNDIPDMQLALSACYEYAKVTAKEKASEDEESK